MIAVSLFLESPLRGALRAAPDRQRASSQSRLLQLYRRAGQGPEAQRRMPDLLRTMPEALLSQYHVTQVLGRQRLQKFVRAHWLGPAERTPSRVLYRVADVRACLRRMEREAVPPDRIESARTNGSAIRHGRGYLRIIGRAGLHPAGLEPAIL